jgi:hypothetical protein
MPPANYLLLHWAAKVTPQQLDTLKKYLHPSETVTPASVEAKQAADQQYQQWIAGGAAPAHDVKPTLNGLNFFTDYATWKPVSYTDRFDNSTMRVILGNDVAQKAIASGNIHPWPDGSAFAKIAYKQQPDGAGNIWTGEFVQVEFMLKDAEKYKSTEGWGFGRWRGVDHKPYGKTANFTTECTSCHRPMQDNDFVYTMPIHDAPGDAFNATAALPDGLPVPLADWRVITTSYDHAHGTISALYGNASAVARSQTSPVPAMTPDVQMALVTWQEQDDKHWFGGHIPGGLQSIEVLSSRTSEAGATTFDYSCYNGSPLKKADANAVSDPVRIDAITSLRAAVMP